MFSCAVRRIALRAVGCSMKPCRSFFPVVVTATPLRTARLYATESSAGAKLDEKLRKRIDDMVHIGPVVVFMKGTPEEPMCGFSRNVKLVLDFHQIPFKHVNVLDDEQVRNGIKEYSDWPTIPQVYVNNTFVGGCDVLVQMHKDGEITDFFETQGIKSKFSEEK